MPQRKARDSDSTKEQILSAAENLFAENGYAGTTLRAISEASGASGPLIVFHFKDKKGVYEAVKAAIVQRYLSQQQHSCNPDLSFCLFIENAIRSMFCFYRDNPTMMRLSNWARLEGDHDPWPGEDECHHLYLDRIEQAQDQGEIRNDLTPLNISIMICGSLHIWWEYHEHFLKHSNAENNAEEADEIYFQQCLSLVLQGLSTGTQETK